MGLFSTLQGARRWGSQEEPTTINMRHFCLLIAFIAAFGISPCVEAAPFGRPSGTCRLNLSASMPDEDPHLQLEDTGNNKRRYSLLLQKVLGQIRGGSDDVGPDEATSGHHGNAKRRRRRRRKTRSSQAADNVPNDSEEEPDDRPQAPAADDNDEGDETDKKGQEGGNKSWLESYLSGTGVADDEADIGATQGEPGDDDVRTSADAEKATLSTVEEHPTQDDDMEDGSDIVAEPNCADNEDTQQTGQRRRRRRRRRSAATTTNPVEEAEQDDIVEEDYDQITTPTDGELEIPAIKVDNPPEASDEVLAMEVKDSADGGGRVKMRRRRRRRTQANAVNTEQAEIVGEEEEEEEEEADPASNNDDQDDNVDATVSETHAELNTLSSPNDYHGGNADVPSDDGDALSDPAEDVTTNAESAPEKEDPPNAEDMAEEPGDSSEDVGDGEVEQKEDSTIFSGGEGINDDETGGESSDTNSEGEGEGEDSKQETEVTDSSEDDSEQSENGDAEKDKAGAEDGDASTSEDEDVNSENAASEDTNDDTSVTGSSDNESDDEDSEDSEEGDADSSDDDDDDDELPSENDEDMSTVLETPIETDSPKTTEVDKGEGGEDSNLATCDAPQDSSEVVEPTETTEVSRESSEEVKVDTFTEITADDEEDADDSTKITVSVVTWNFAEASPSEDEAKFLRQFRKAHPSLSSQDGRKGSDIVLIGGQETEDIKPRRAEGNRSRELRRLVIKMLGKDYVPIAIHSLGGVQFCLCVRREILNEVELCSVADVTCGIGNVFHNKGAICAYVQMKARNKKENSNSEDEESSTTKRQKSVKMLFVAAHMAAHVKNVDARNEDFWRIASELEAQAPPRFLRPKSPREEDLVDAENVGGSHLIDSMDHVFFCGDLNYRIDLPREITEYTVMQIEECLQQGNEREADKLRLSLLRHDQLSRVMSEGAAFLGFAEGKITFPPTFKFDKGTKSYDTSHKQRVPAFTDRILFKPFGVRVLEYRSEVDATHSDHRPVTGTFLVDIEGKKLPEQSRRQKPKKRSRRKKSRPGGDQY